MKLLFENWRKFVNEVKNLVCPPATQDVNLNTENRNATRENHMYGPLNVEEPGDYWQRLAEKWNTRGIIIIDYLISIFSILMKGSYLKNNSTIKNLYTSLFKVISISPSRSIAVLRLLLENKRYSLYNLNQKFYFDNLLIVLNKNLY